MIELFENWSREGIKDFYECIIALPPIKNFYLCNITVLKTFRGLPKRKIKTFTGEILPYTGAVACGYGSIVEKVHFCLSYSNINYQKTICKEGLYLRGCCALTDRTGGYRIRWKRGKK